MNENETHLAKYYRRMMVERDMVSLCLREQADYFDRTHRFGKAMILKIAASDMEAGR